jgi:hypothetical protein
MLLPRHQNGRQIQDMKVANRCFENVTQFRYLGMTVTNQNFIQEEIKRRVNLGDSYYCSVQNLLTSCQLPKSAKKRKYKTIILLMDLYGC